MKKTINKFIKVGLISGLSLLSTMSFAQLEEGDILVEGTYGVMGVKGVLFALVEAADTDGEVVTSYVGPAGLSFQYMVGGKFGIGFDANYQTRSASWTDENSTLTWNDSTWSYDEVTTTEDYKVKQSIMRLMIRTSWEFVNTENFQVSWINSVGYRNATWEYEGSGLEDDYTFGGNPLGFRTAIGMRYLFTPNVGINANLSAGGGSYMNLGLTGRF